MFKKIVLPLVVLSLLTVSCTKDLNRAPDVALTSETLYKTEAGYKSSLAKLYGGLALTGNNGPDGSGDLGGIDEGFSSYIRNYWNLQELPTDEAVIGWNDATIKDFHNMSWSASDVFLRAFYSRLFYQITLANAFIREAADDNLSKRGISGADAAKVKGYQAEARFLRALSYYHALDLYGNPTFVTEQDAIGAFIPKQTTRAALFAYVESELKAVESLLPEPKQNEYGRVDKAAAWMTLANLYLNAQVYTGTQRYSDAVAYSAKVIAAPYTLNAKYGNNFLADNHTSSEIIFAVPFDGIKTRSWGGTTYLVHAPVGGDMNKNDFGIDGGWGGLRTTRALVEKFEAGDQRGQFQSAGQSLDIEDIGDFRNGWSIRKWKNVTSSGANGSNLTWVDTDFPLYRLAEAYLIYAEAVLRGGTGGNRAQALAYVNKLRERAFGNTISSVDDTQLNLDFILDERARELHWEGKRRTDLIRYEKFTTAAYLWPWKGGVKSGTAVGSFRNLYPIPSAEINSNPNLRQNNGY